MATQAEAVLGFRPHTYWTAAVALAGPAEAPEVLERRRITFAESRHRFVFHQAAEGERDRAEALIAEVKAATEAKAAKEIGDMAAAVRSRGLDVQAAVVPVGTAKVPETLDAILKVHAMMHAAEGSFYREVVAAGCAAAGLQVTRVVERELPGLCEALLKAPPSLEARMRAMGEALGPPWSEDYRLATQAAWLRLAAV